MFEFVQQLHLQLFQLQSLQFLLTGVLLGFAASISPGPTLALVISETLTKGYGEGIKVAVAPLITDAPIIILTLYFLQKLAQYNFFLGTISLVGALFLLYFGYSNINMAPKNVEQNIDFENANKGSKSSGSLFKGIVTNALNPHPYIFWLTIGSPLLLKAYSVSLMSAIAFILGFYLLLVGSKIFLAYVVSKSKAFIKGRTYILLIKGTGVILILLSFVLAKDGLQLFGAF